MGIYHIHRPVASTARHQSIMSGLREHCEDSSDCKSGYLCYVEECHDKEHWCLGGGDEDCGGTEMCDAYGDCVNDPNATFTPTFDTSGIVTAIIVSSIIGFLIFVGCVVGCCWWFKKVSDRNRMNNNPTVVHTIQLQTRQPNPVQNAQPYPVQKAGA